MSAGRLSVVATPIGHLDDITLRALAVLKSADVIAAEDTRAAAVLLGHHGIKKPLVSYFEGNERERSQELLGRLHAGAHVALICQAGTPTISDPGYRIVVAAAQANIRVEPIPGPSAALAALSASGLPSDRFYFIGFLPRTEARRRRELAKLKELPSTLLFYESPRRTGATLADLAAVLGGERQAVLGRELTKLHEELVRGTLAQLADRFADEPPRGEVTLVVAGADEAALTQTPEQIEAEIERRLAAGESPSHIARSLAEALGLSKRDVYATTLKMIAESATGDDES